MRKILVLFLMMIGQAFGVITQLDTEFKDGVDITSSYLVLTDTPDGSEDMICQAYMKIGGAGGVLSGGGGNFELVITIDGFTVQPSPQVITFGTETASSVWTTQFPVPSNTEVKLYVKSPNAADSAVDVTSYLYDVFSSQVIEDTVWDAALTGNSHNDGTSAGKRLRQTSDVTVIREEEQAQSATASTITLHNDANSVNGFYGNTQIVITGGTGIGQVRHIHSYVGNTRVATISPDWSTTPSGTIKYVIRGDSEKHTMMISDDVITSGVIAHDAIGSSELALSAVEEIINNFETQSNIDPTGFKVNMMEVNGTPQTANDMSGDIDAILADTSAFDTAAEWLGLLAAVDTDATSATHAATYITLEAGKASNDAYNGMSIAVTDATDSNTETRRIEDYTSGRKVTFDRALSFTPVQDDIIRIYSMPYNIAAAIAGGTANTYIVTDTGAVGGTGIADVQVWLTIDSAGARIIVSGTTDDNGEVVFYLDSGITYYVWMSKSGYTFSDNGEAWIAD